MDQMARGGIQDKPADGANALVLIGSRGLATELGDLAKAVNHHAPHNFRFDYQFDRNADPLNAYCRMMKIGHHIRDYVSAVANLDQRPLLDKPRPDAYATCKQ